MSSEMETKPEMERYESSILQTFNAMSLATPLKEFSVGISNDEKKEALETLWKSFCEGIDKYIDLYNVPKIKNKGETDPQFYKRLLISLRDINSGKGDVRDYSECPSVSINLAGGAFNCVYGSQIAAKVLGDLGHNVMIGNPYGHANLIIDKSYLFDASVGCVARVGGVNRYDTSLTVYEPQQVLFGRVIYPYKIIPVITPYKSMALTLNNLDHLYKYAQHRSEFAKRVVESIKLDGTVDYSKAKKYFLPESARIKDLDWWQLEANNSESVNAMLSSQMVEEVDLVG